MPNTLSIVIPTYNERENILKLIKSLGEELAKNSIKYELVIVDDNSPDGTAELCEKISKKRKNIIVIKRPGKLGLSSAVIDGFKKARGGVIGVMDADFSHPVSAIPRMFNEIEKGADLVIGSRYAGGGSTKGWPVKRKITSWGATMIAKMFTKIRDPVSGLLMFRRGAIDNVRLSPIGYKIGLEIIVKGNYNRVAEIPYVFVNRKIGKTKLDAREYVNYLKQIASLVAYRMSRKVKIRSGA
ncbi:MAG: polyprenol monophosphomannose synthase [Candidatus Aenigmarchaeota archaeon]|nr:polyprenol monophosphomannose synthase [Candidatus Aenigmarchaeota archaeon]